MPFLLDGAVGFFMIYSIGFPKRQADAPEIDFIFYRNNFISLLTKGTIFTCISTLISRVFNKQKYICHTQNWEYRRDIQVQNCTMLYTHTASCCRSPQSSLLSLCYGTARQKNWETHKGSTTMRVVADLRVCTHTSSSRLLQLLQAAMRARLFRINISR